MWYKKLELLLARCNFIVLYQYIICCPRFGNGVVGSRDMSSCSNYTIMKLFLGDYNCFNVKINIITSII